MNGAVMVCGTSSDVGKSHVVAGLCRLLARRGVRVAPFKGQNMSLNSAVTPDGLEIGRAQEVQARAARVPPEVAMNPVLLKPTGERSSQVIVMGRPVGTYDAPAYQRLKPDLQPIVLAALADLRRRFDVVICEGAGSPAEINLMEGDLVNLGLARLAGVPALVVGDIERGGVLAHLYGTVALLPDDLAPQVRGFVVNKFRGDPALLGDAFAVLEERCGVPTLGVLPFLHGVSIDAEDSLALAPTGVGAAAGPAPMDHGSADPAPPAGHTVLDVAVVRFPRLSNFTDLDALAIEPAVSVRYVDRPGALGDPDLVVLPGTKSTVSDLRWARQCGLVAAIERLRSGPRPPMVLGICGGFQMMGARVDDPAGVEADAGSHDGLGWLDVVTTFRHDKRTLLRSGREVGSGTPVTGYEIHHGMPVPGGRDPAWLSLGPPDTTADTTADTNGAGPGSADGAGPGSADGSPTGEGCRDDDAGLYGTILHGLLESDELRGALLARAARRRGKHWVPSAVSFAAAREQQLDRLADACHAHLDLPALWAIVAEGRLG
jgi:adenosylcobyric acid synthase